MAAIRGMRMRCGQSLGLCEALLGTVCATPAWGQALTLERLSLFAVDGARSAEDRPIPPGPSDLAQLGLQRSFSETASGDVTWTWRLKNASAANKLNLRFTVFLDADLNAAANTFFNESGELIALSAPAQHIAADRWEIGEPGYTRATR